LAFTSEVEEMGTIGVTGETGEVGDVGEPRYCASRPMLLSCQVNVGRSY
jgi:hypothetical protein